MRGDLRGGRLRGDRPLGRGEVELALRPLGFALAVGLLWHGAVWLRWMVGVACLLSGGVLLFYSAKVMILVANMTPPDELPLFMQVAGYPLSILGVFGLFYVVAGLLFLFSPSMRTFFAHQRGTPRVVIEAG